MHMRLKKTVLSFSVIVMATFAVSMNLSMAARATDTLTLPGDVNENGVVSLADAVTLQKWLIKKNTGSVNLKNADLYEDEFVNVFDLQMLKQKLLNSVENSERCTGLIINEVCTSNKEVFKDSNNNSPDWIELYNASENPIDLSGIGVSDGKKNRYKFTFPDGASIDAEGYLLIACDKNMNVDGMDYAAPFNLSAEGETIYLTCPQLPDGSCGEDIDIVDVPELKTDTSYGRYKNASGKFFVLTPTPNTSNDTASKIISVSSPVFSKGAGFYDEAFGLTLSDTAGNQIVYTLDGSDPRDSKTSQIYDAPISIYNNTHEPSLLSDAYELSGVLPLFDVDRGIVVRAASRDSDGNYSAVITNGYYIEKNAEMYSDMKIISLSTDSSCFFDHSTGIYWNYEERGREWERPCNIQVYENRELQYTEDVGIRISGNYSRTFPQKSFTLYARKEYGNTKMKYDFFDGAVTDKSGNIIDEFDKIGLRNGGNDLYGMHIRDDINQSFCSGLSFDTQGSANSIVFLNGEFWGFYSLKEKLDENYVESHYGVKSDNVTMLECGEYSCGDDELYWSYIDFFHEMEEADLSDDENYEAFCDKIDIQSYIDYIVCNTVICNADWSTILYNNYRLWRSNLVDDTNPYADGKWRFMMYDTDIASGTTLEPYYADLTQYYTNTFDIIDRQPDHHNITYFFFKLMENETFRKQFYDSYLSIVGENFSTERTLPYIKQKVMETHAANRETQRRFLGWEPDCEYYENEIYYFYKNRPEYALHYLNQLYGIEDTLIEKENLIDDIEQWNLKKYDDSNAAISIENNALTLLLHHPWSRIEYRIPTKEGNTYKLSYTVKSEQESIFTESFAGHKERLASTEEQTYTSVVKADGNYLMLKFYDFSDWEYTFSDFSLICIDEE